MAGGAARGSGGGGGGGGGALLPRNSKLDSFLKRNTERDVYERIRASEPCVVVSERVKRVYMHVVLSDERVYLAQYPPRTLSDAVAFSQIRDIELVNDLPDFLRGKDRDSSQHIRVVYTTTKQVRRRRDDWLRREKKEELPSPRNVLSAQKDLRVVDSLLSENHWRISPEPQQRTRGVNSEDVVETAPTRSAPCRDVETLGPERSPPQPSPDTPSPALILPWHQDSVDCSPADRSPHAPTAVQLSGRRLSVVDRLLQKEQVNGEEGEREAELHLYAVSRDSRIYHYLQSSWNSHVIRSTLLLDPLYRRMCSVPFNSSYKYPMMSRERTAHLFRQLSAEVLQEGLGLENLYLLLQELRTAAHRNVTLRKLFWGSSEVCMFLVQTLEDSLSSCHALEMGPRGVHTADQILLCTLIAQTLAVMFRETELEPARLSMLTAKRGALTIRLLLAVVCDPEFHADAQGSRPKLQTLLVEYLDAACSLLFELVLLGQEASRCSSLENFMTVGWILRVLQPHRHLLAFIGYQAQQVVSALTDPGLSALSPAQSVLLFQRCGVLVAGLQHSPRVGHHLRSHFGEEFRYFVKPSCAAERLPACYPISQPAQRLFHQLLALILQR